MKTTTQVKFIIRKKIKPNCLLQLLPANIIGESVKDNACTKKILGSKPTVHKLFLHYHLPISPPTQVMPNKTNYTILHFF